MENFSIGNALGTGFRVWFKNLPAFMLLSLIIYSPVLIYTYSVLDTDNVFVMAEKVNGLEMFMRAWGFFAQFVIASTIIYAIVQELSGHHAGLGASISKGLSRFFPVLGVSLLAAIGIVLGLILLIVPGAILFCMWFVAVPAAVIERPGVTGALSRSSELTKGHRWEIFGIFVVIQLITFAILMFLKSTFIDNVQDLGDIKVFVWSVIGVSLVMGVLQASIQGVSYFLLRREKEGTGADELARVFD